MKFPLSWLHAHLDTSADVAAICDTLTRIGIEVEGVTDTAAPLAPFVIARVIEAVQHPNADRLRALRVDMGANTRWCAARPMPAPACWAWPPCPARISPAPASP